jgi:hypothetical protein
LVAASSALPAPLVRHYALSEGDTVFFDADGDALKLKFVRICQP